MGAFNAASNALANFNPDKYAQGNLAASLENQQRQANLGLAPIQQQAEQQKLQQAQIQTQLQQQQLRDGQIVRQVYADHVNDDWSDPSSYQSLRKDAIKAGISYPGLQQFDQHDLQMREGVTKLSSDQIGLHKQITDRAADIFQNYKDLASTDKQLNAWPQIATELKSLGLPYDPARPVLGDDLDATIAKTAHTKDLIDAQAKAVEERLHLQQTRTSAAEAGQHEQETIKLKTVNTAMQQAMANPQSGAEQIHAALGGLDPTMEVPYTTAWQAAMKAGDLQGAAHIVAAAASHAASVSPTKQQFEVNTAAKRAAAEAPIHTATAVNTEAAKIRLQQQLSPDAFAGIASPQTRAQAERAYQDYSNKFIDSMESAQGLHDLIAQAQGGNKAAPGLISIAELRTYLNRVNRTELQAVGSHAGNLLDRVQGVIGGLTEGQPVPPDIMQGVDQIATMQQQAAQRKYGNQIGLMKTTYGKVPEPFQWQPHGGQSAQPATAAPKGNGQKLTDPNIARQYLQNAGGDKEKARQLAKQDGWTF